MTITDDKITFEASDFDGLSDLAKKALTAYLDDYAAHFAKHLNSFLSVARQHVKNVAASDPVTDAILAGLASADEAKLKEAEPLLAQLNSLLNPKS